MNIFKRIIEFFKNWKNNKTSQLTSQPVLRLNSAKDRFYDSLRIIKKNKVEVIKCVGDGVGIETVVRN